MAERRSDLITRLRRRVLWPLDWRFADLRRRIDDIGRSAAEIGRASGELAALRAELAEARTRLEDVAAALAVANANIDALRERMSPVLRAIVTVEAAHRRRLEVLRTEPEYTVPFEHPDPLITVCIPTHDRVETLIERSLPSVLAQTHRNLEVVVVGDASPPHVGAAVEAIGDERVRFVNLTHRRAPTDAELFWMVSSVAARNAGYEQARGQWIVDFDDDDSMRPEAIERVLAKARAERLEVVYGRLAAHFADGREEIIGRFPPTVHQFGWQGAVVHAGLRFLGRQSVASAFGHPSDWFRVETMMRIGVRFGMVDDVVDDYYPARSWNREADVPESELTPPARAR